MGKEPDITVEFVSDAIDVEKVYVRSFVEYSRTGHAAQQQTKLHRISLIALIVSSVPAVLYFISIAQDWLRPSQLLVVSAIVVPLISLGVFTNSGPKHLALKMRQLAERLAKSPAARIAFGRHVVSVESAGFRIVAEHYETLYRWSMVTKIEHDEDATYVDTVNFGSFRIPNRAFNERVTQRQFMDAIEEKIASSGFDISTRILAYATAKVAKCPGCGYPLARLVVLRCPECARVPTLDDFPDAIHTLDRADT